MLVQVQVLSPAIVTTDGISLFSPFLHLLYTETGFVLVK